MTHSKFQPSHVKALCLIVLLALAAAPAAMAMDAVDTININTATVDQLMQLDRVGQKYAEKIVEYRETVGPFNTPEEIMNVKGIGQKTWEANKERIVV